MPRRFVSEFLLPLVKGGAVHVGRPLGPRAVERIAASLASAPTELVALGESARASAAELPPGEQDALRELARHRRLRIAELLPHAQEPPLDAVALGLGAAAHNLLALSHPELGGRGQDARQE